MDTSEHPWLTDSAWGQRALQLAEHLPENHRRWFAGLLSWQVGYGGDRSISDLLALHEDTVRRGKREVEAGLDDRPPDRTRLPGGGRPPVEKKDSTIEADLAELAEPETAGDPCSSKKWTRKSLRELAKGLRKKGHRVSHHTVKRLLKKGGIRSRGTENASPARRTRTGTRSSGT